MVWLVPGCNLNLSCRRRRRRRLFVSHTVGSSPIIALLLCLVCTFYANISILVYIFEKGVGKCINRMQMHINIPNESVYVSPIHPLSIDENMNMDIFLTFR